MSTNYEVTESPGVVIKSWTKGVLFEEQARQQLKNIASLPFIHHHVAAMADVHLGKGATIGSVIATRKAIIPAAVGVDLGCGVSAIRTSLTASDLPDNLDLLRSAIESAVPHGRSDNGDANDKGSWQEAPDSVYGGWISILARYNDIVAKHKDIEHRRAKNQLGTLGTNNHFIEVCLDENQNVWVMLHSGSRGPGNRIGTYFIDLAKKEMEKWFIHLPDKDLAYLPEGSVLFDDYMEAVLWAQDYAKINRKLMMGAAVKALQANINKPFSTDIEVVDCHHNYVAMESHFGQNVYVTRKGAVRARVGDYGLIPGSMGTKSFVVKGKGNLDSFQSCSHGAGRAMSKTEAKKRFTVEEHVKATEGVNCRKDADVIDETPGSYKDIMKVMSAQSDLVEIVHEIKQVLCVKG